VLDGDLPVIKNRLRAALDSLPEAGINIVAIRSRMTGEGPGIIFFHQWGCGLNPQSCSKIQNALPLESEY
jgi:Domain of Unknown Function (DUF1259)